MPKTGVLIETENGTIKDINYGLLTAARGNGDNEVTAFTVDEPAPDAAETLAKYGVSTLARLETTGSDIHSSPDFAAAAITDAAKEYGVEYLLGLATAPGRDIFARIAAGLDTQLVSDVQEVDFSGNTAVKSHFSGKTMATLKLEGNPVLLTVRPNAVIPAEIPAEIKTVEFKADVSGRDKVRVSGLKEGGQGRKELTEAAVIVTGGRPIGKPENYRILEACADVLDGAVGASRAAVDAGFAPHSMQVGQTGKTVSPNLYIACGVSGAVQHFAGMKTSKVIVGINTDKDAPIFEKCDYGIVGDMFEVVPVLTEVLKETLNK